MTDPQQNAATTSNPPCPKCKGDMWDNRVGKKNPRAPDFKCKDRGCDGVIWPPRSAAPVESSAPPAEGMPNCPVCGGPMWDDRLTKRNPKAPDFKCRNKPKERGGPGCEGVIWPPRSGTSPYPPPVPRASRPPLRDAPPMEDAPLPDGPPPDDDDYVPF